MKTGQGEEQGAAGIDKLPQLKEKQRLPQSLPTGLTFGKESVGSKSTIREKDLCWNPTGWVSTEHRNIIRKIIRLVNEIPIKVMAARAWSIIQNGAGKLDGRGGLGALNSPSTDG